MNQARLCFTKILHSYHVGATLIEEDRHQVLQLLSDQQLGNMTPIRNVQVVRAQFGRNCLEVHSLKDSKQKMSITKCIKQKVAENSYRHLNAT